MVTIKDVAKHAGVSVTTTSYALNGEGNISEATRQRVLAVAEQLNYHPNAFARHLKTSKTHTIGIFITRFGGAFYEDILEGIHDVILKTDYELIVCPESRPAHNILMYRQVDGAIVFDSKIASDVLLKLAAATFPVVVMDRALQHEFIFPLLLDNEQGVRQAFHHFYNQGLRRLSFVAGPLGSFDSSERMRAFLDEARQRGLDVPIYYGDFTEASGYAAGEALLACANPPEGVFCANDQMAIGLLRALQARGLRAPDDIAVVGFDDILLASYIQPTLSTVRASRALWGAQAATRLLNFLEHHEQIDTQRVPTEFIPRQSSTRLLRASA